MVYIPGLDLAGLGSPVVLGVLASAKFLPFLLPLVGVAGGLLAVARFFDLVLVRSGTEMM